MMAQFISRCAASEVVGDAWELLLMRREWVQEGVGDAWALLLDVRG